MKYSKLGTSGLSVSRVCLGTMTWGSQNVQAEADEQIEYALSQGVNFMDTAELYPVPPSAETAHRTEKIIGNWISRNSGRRQDFILATKITGSGLPHIRQGGPITAQGVFEALDASLSRLQTDYIDLYQLHWPNWQNTRFGNHHPGDVNFSQLKTEELSAQILEILEALDQCIKAGKIRHFGLSDDSPWSLSEYIRLSDKHGLPRPVSIQNEFSLIHAMDWPHLIEFCLREDIAYLPWSPLAGGFLTGKYLNGARPEGCRWSKEQRHGLFRDTSLANAAMAEYLQVAQKHNLTPAELALGWCDQTDGITSTIIGATKLSQLKENIGAFEKPLSEEVLADILTVYKKYPVPF